MSKRTQCGARSLMHRIALGAFALALAAGTPSPSQAGFLMLVKKAGVQTITPPSGWDGTTTWAGRPAEPTPGVGTTLYSDNSAAHQANPYRQAVIGVMDEYPYRYITTNTNAITFGGVQADDSRQDIDHVDFWFEGATATVKDQGINPNTKSVGYNVLPVLVAGRQIGGDAKLCATAVPVNGYSRTVCLPVTFDPNGKTSRLTFYVDNSLGTPEPGSNKNCAADEGSTPAKAFPSISRAESCMNKLTPSGIGGAIVKVKPSSICYNVDATGGTVPGQQNPTVTRIVEFHSTNPAQKYNICRSDRGTLNSKSYWTLFLNKVAFYDANIDLTNIPAIGNPVANTYLTFANSSFTDPGGPTGQTPPAGSVGPQTYGPFIVASYDGLFINTAGRYSIVDSALVGPTIAGVHLLRNTSVNYSWDLGYFQDPNAMDIGYFNVTATQVGSYYTRPHQDGWLNVTSAKNNPNQACKYPGDKVGVTTITADYTGSANGYTYTNTNSGNNNYKNDVYFFRVAGVDKPGPNLDTRTYDGQGMGLGEARTGAYSLDTHLCYAADGTTAISGGNCPIIKTAVCDPNNELGNTLQSGDAYAVFNDLHPDVAQSGLSGSTLFAAVRPANIFFSGLNVYSTNSQGFFNQLINGYDAMSTPGSGMSAAAGSTSISLSAAINPNVAVGDKITTGGQARYVTAVTDGQNFTVNTSFSSSALSSVSYTRVPTLTTQGASATLSSAPPTAATAIKVSDEFMVIVDTVDQSVYNDYAFVFSIQDATHFTLYHPFSKNLTNASIGHIPTLKDFAMVNSRFLAPLTPQSQGGTVSTSTPGITHQQAQNQAGCLHCIFAQNNFSADTGYGFWMRNYWGVTTNKQGGGMEGSAFYDNIFGSLTGYSPGNGLQSTGTFPLLTSSYPQGVAVDGNAFNVGAQAICANCFGIDSVGSNAFKGSITFDANSKPISGNVPPMRGVKGSGKPFIPVDLTGKRLLPGQAIMGPIQPSIPTN